uniref:Uncharacterized protein n=1 Tax=Timema bartmani TaxID=61472 RepID=A0A7R9F361_9NEOP|nr:unnamed protein product [Timema bartmani]
MKTYIDRVTIRPDSPDLEHVSGLASGSEKCPDYTNMNRKRGQIRKFYSAPRHRFVTLHHCALTAFCLCVQFKVTHSRSPQSGRLSVVYIVYHLKKTTNCIPFAAKQLQRKLKNEEAVDYKKEENFLKSEERFYKAGINYLKRWENCFDHFKWLTLQHDPTWDEMEDSALTVASVIPDSINVDLFDERSSLIQILKNMKPEWDSLPKDETPKTQEKWKQPHGFFGADWLTDSSQLTSDSQQLGTSDGDPNPHISSNVCLKQPAMEIEDLTPTPKPTDVLQFRIRTMIAALTTRINKRTRCGKSASNSSFGLKCARVPYLWIPVV